MRAQVLRHKAFVNFLLDSESTPQALQLLKGITQHQAKAVSEIFLNLLRGNFDKHLTEKERPYVRHLRLIGSLDTPLNKRKLIIQTKRNLILKILRDLKDPIQDLLKTL